MRFIPMDCSNQIALLLTSTQFANLRTPMTHNDYILRVYYPYRKTNPFCTPYWMLVFYSLIDFFAAHESARSIPLQSSCKLRGAQQFCLFCLKKEFRESRSTLSISRQHTNCFWHSYSICFRSVSRISCRESFDDLKSIIVKNARRKE